MPRKSIDVEQIDWTERIEEDISMSGILSVTGSISLKGNQVKITSPGPTSIFLEADTDNTTETDTTYLKLSQDGGLVTGLIGFTPANNKDPENNDFTGVRSNSLLITNSYENGQIYLGASGSAALTVHGERRVGIKTTYPKTDFHVAGDGATIRLGNDALNTDQYDSHLQFCELGIGTDMLYGHSFNYDATNNRLELKRHNNDASGTSVMTFLREHTRIGIGTVSPATELHINGALTIEERTSDPSNPSEGHSVLWMSDGTGSGDDGDILIKITAGGVTKIVTLVDFSAS